MEIFDGVTIQMICVRPFESYLPGTFGGICTGTGFCPETSDCFEKLSTKPCPTHSRKVQAVALEQVSLFVKVVKHVDKLDILFLAEILQAIIQAEGIAVK